MNEFELIRTFFASHPVARDDVVIGIGDDAAVVRVPDGMQAVVTTDTLVAGVHFLPDADPVSVGHKALAVNVSDLAAMGAEPAWFTLNLTLPEVNTAWLQRFCEGMFGLARRYNMQLIGGNTSRGPLAIVINAHGLVPEGQALRRSGAKAGDRIYVTGELGDAGLALLHQLGKLHLPDPDIIAIADRLARPMPCIQGGMALRGIANSAVDISDGLIADLGHILESSHAGARVFLGRVPVSTVYRKYVGQIGWDVALANGDDYELCFTAPQENTASVERLKSELRYTITYIGDVVAEPGLSIFDNDGKPYEPRAAGHDHFQRVDP